MHPAHRQKAPAAPRHSNRAGHGLGGHQEWPVAAIGCCNWLLQLVEPLFDVFITTDKNLRYQQNLRGRRLAFIVLPTNQVPIVARLALALDAILATIKPGDFVEIPFPP